jgi:hypothetical protein
MSHAFLFVPTTPSADGAGEFRKGVQALAGFKAVEITDTATSGVASVAVAPNRKAAGKRVYRSGDGQIWIVDLGTWLPLPAKSGCDASWLVEQYRNHGVREMARRLQGVFSLLIVDLRSRRVHVVTDRCGSLHVYYRRFPDGYAVCSSSAVLALCADSRLDPIAVHEFVATGIVYEERSLWADVQKIGPATVLTFDGSGVDEQTYWTFSEVDAEKLNLEEAVEQTHHGLVEVLKALPDGDQPLISDLTGGYDSRLLLAGLLDAGRPFRTTVSGSTSDHPDVVVAGRIASEFGLQHQHVMSERVPSAEEFDAALRMTDGEYDAFDYARILHTHRLLSAGNRMSLNGSFGELARGYWWELLWPNLAQHRSLDAEMVARRRFAAVAYDASIFDVAGQLNLRSHMAEVVSHAIRPIAGFPNTSQMDCVYFTLRMQRWQGRIGSSTNQLWPAFPPIGFAQVLDPILAARAKTRFRSLLVRRLFARFAPRLSRLPLEHGYPPMPATAMNLWRFAPVLAHYGGKVVSKVSARLAAGNSARVAEPAPALALRPENAAIFCDTDMAVWMRSPLLQETGLFRPEPLRAMLNPDGTASGGQVEQWRRLATVEALLRTVGGLRRHYTMRD